jgi:O-acetylhomoserine (thiol)-lyase
MKRNTALLHGTDNLDPATGSPLPPIAQVSAFAQPSAEQMERVFRSQAPGYSYTRLANPTIAAFERRIAQLEGGVGAVACASGMAAVSMALLNILQCGDEFIATSRLYGGTLSLFHDLEHLGITPRFSDSCDPASIEALITPSTRLIFTEAISNPGLDVADIAALADLAHRHNLPLLVDSTTATPILLQPLSLGADVVIHSSSKYINGSGSAISGIIVDGGRFVWDGARWPVLAPYTKMPKLAYTMRLRQDIWQHFGPCLSPQNAFLNTLGLETIGLRVERECENALALAQALQKLPGIYDVNYPGLTDSPSHDLAQKQLTKGMGGALLTFRAGSKERAFRLMNHLKYAYIVSNIGDVRTLVVHPSSSIYIHSSLAEQESAGVFTDLIRVSVGIEDIEDLIEDFTQAVKAADKTD